MRNALDVFIFLFAQIMCSLYKYDRIRTPPYIY